MFKIAIIDSRPSGLSAAAHASELGRSLVLLESEQHAADTIYKYEKGKYVMAERNVLPLRSPMSFKAGRREDILGADPPDGPACSSACPTGAAPRVYLERFLDYSNAVGA